MATNTHRLFVLALTITGMMGWGQLSPLLADETSISLQEATQAKCDQVLRQAVGSDEFWPSLHAAEALTLSGKGGKVQQRLEPRLKKEEDDQHRCGLARELVRAGDREKVTVLFDSLAGQDTQPHMSACERLDKVNEVGDKRLLRQAMCQTENNVKPLMAAAALGRSGDSETLTFVRKQLGHDNPKTARIAAQILARLGVAQDRPKLRAEAKRFNDPLTRAFFDHALAALGDPAGLLPLEKNLLPADPWVRSLAATFAGDARATFSGERLVGLRDDEDIDARAAQSLLVLSQPTLPPTARENRKGLTWIDWLLIVFYAASTIGLGVYFSRKQESTNEYFIGSGNMNPILIGVSLFATLVSTISYLSMPGEAAGKGPVTLVGLLALPFVFLIVGLWIIPVYMKQRVTSAYELLEERLGLSIRLLGAGMFLTLRLIWMTLLVYLASKALADMMSVDESWIPLIVLITGGVSLVYTSLGGLRAVVITDFMQTVLLFGGALLIIVTVSWDFGGFGWFPTTWHVNWDTQPFFSTDPKTRVTVVGTFLTILTWNVATSAGDQTSVQRFMSTRDANAARRSLAIQLTVGAVVGLTLYAVGFALLGYYDAHPENLRAGLDTKANADQLFPIYIADQLPVGVAGLVVSAMFAAAMSSIDSGVNSITAVVMTDFLDRFGLEPKTEKGRVRVARLLAFGIGTVVVLGSNFTKYIEGNIMKVTSKTVNLLTTPIFALFFFAIFVRRASAAGVWIGALFGTVTAATIAFSGPLVYLLHTRFGVDPATFGVELITRTDQLTGATWMTVEDPISFQYIGPVSLAINIVVGYIACWLFPKRDT